MAVSWSFAEAGPVELDQLERQADRGCLTLDQAATGLRAWSPGRSSD